MTGDTVTTWALIVSLAAVAFLTRAAFTLPEGRLHLSPTMERVLRFAPAAALMAIVIPDIARLDGVIRLSLDNPRLLAGAAAFLIAALTRNILLTIVVGLVVLQLMKMVG